MLYHCTRMALHMHARAHMIHIYIYIYICVCMCVRVYISLSPRILGYSELLSPLDALIIVSGTTILSMLLNALACMWLAR